MIFLGGIHGAGKDTACKEVFSPLGYIWTTAGKLIDASGAKKQVANVRDNQRILLQQLGSFRGKHYRSLLNGHFTLINQEGDIEPIGTDVFAAMKADELILLTGPPKEIAARLQQRDGKKWSVAFVTEFQRYEEKRAHEVAKEIGVDLHVARSVHDLVNITKAIHLKR